MHSPFGASCGSVLVATLIVLFACNSRGIDLFGQPPSLWSDAPPGAGSHHEAGLVSLLESLDAPCDQVHEAVIRTVHGGYREAGGTVDALIERLQWVLEHLAEDGTPYTALWRYAAHATLLALDTLQLLSLTTMAHKHCFSSAARLALGGALVPMNSGLRQQLSTMWWMFDIGQYSNTNNPAKHFEAVLRTVKHTEAVFKHLSSTLPLSLASADHFWGHKPHGMFVNSTVVYRSLFPESALLDKGLLRRLLRLLPFDASVGDFGALDGQYAKWLNDTGLVTAFAFDGVEGVSQITEGTVSEVDLAEEIRIPWRAIPFDWVLCLEVAEHIPPEHEHVFLANLARHALQGLVLSWAPPWIEGEGHVNCLPLDESQERVESFGFRLDPVATDALRMAADIPWIRASVAVYSRT